MVESWLLVLILVLVEEEQIRIVQENRSIARIIIRIQQKHLL
jgi:hypothetical protein